MPVSELLVLIGIGFLFFGLILLMFRLDQGQGWQKKMVPIRVRTNRFSGRNIREPDDQAFVLRDIDWLIPISMLAALLIFLLATLV